MVQLNREGGEPRSKGPTEGKVKSDITFCWEERWEILRDHKPYQRNSNKLRNKPAAISDGHLDSKVMFEEPDAGNLLVRD